MRRYPTVLRLALLSSCGAVGALLSSPVLAQSADADVGASNPGDIIVTAERRAQRLEEVPAAITALSAEQIQKSGVVRLMDLAQIAPGVQFQKGGYTTQPSVRGISSLTTGFGFESNTALYIDGFYQPDSVAINADLANISQIEILKGPQGTLYGRNATAGAILINTREPSDTFAAEGKASYARFNEYQLQGYVNAPLAKGIALNVAGTYRRSDGYIHDLGTDGKGTGGYNAVPTKNDALRVKLLLQPADWAKITVGYNYGKVLDAIGLSYTIYDHAPSTLPTPPLRATQRDTVTNNGRPDNTAKLNEATLLGEFDTGIGKLALRTSYADRKTHIYYDFDGSKATIFAGVIPAHQRTFQQSADFNLNPVPNLDVLIGALYFKDDIDIVGQQAFSNGALITSDSTFLNAEAISAYVDATYHIGNLSLTGGVRYSHERKEVSYSQQIAATPVAPGAAKATFSRATPRFVARYEVAPRTNVYASFSTGFRSGVFQNQVLPDPRNEVPIKPEKITAYEIGLKTAQSNFRFDAAAFYYKYTDLHVSVTIPNPVTGIGVISTLINAKAAEIYGGEAQVTVTPVPDWNVSAGISLVHARYTDFHNARGTGLNATTGLNASNQVQDWTGQQLARAPSSSATFQTDYTFPALGGKTRLAMNASYSASYVVSNPSLYGPLAAAGLANTQRYRQGAYALVNAQVSWTDSSDHYTITAFVNNLTNTRFLLVTSGGGFGDYRNYNQPISAGGSVAFRF